MAHNHISVQVMPDQEFPIANAPVRTIPSNDTPNVDVTNTVPSRDEYPQPSAPDPSELPPKYFDISIVPNIAVLYYNQVVPFTEPSRAIVRHKKDVVLTLDPLVDSNPDQLWLYFMTYLNEKPSLNMNIHGSHTEVPYSFSFRRTNTSLLFSITLLQNESVWVRGNTLHELSITRQVTDFSLSLDLAEYVCPQWSRVAVIPSKEAIKKGETVSLREAIEQYTRSEKSFEKYRVREAIAGLEF